MTDALGQVSQHVQYYPFGETWVEEHSNRQRTPFLFTGKELDEETGLYYFGARYYDPRTSVWQSPDPILGDYLPKVGQTPEDLPGNGGVFEPANLSLFAYVHNKPTRLVDPTGLSPYDGQNPFPYTAGNGVSAHQLFSQYARGQISGAGYSEISTDRTMGTIFERIVGSALGPDLVASRDFDSSRSYVWELKPITWLNNPEKRLAAQAQLASYTGIAFQSGETLLLGDPRDVVPTEGYYIGTVLPRGGPNTQTYDVRLYSGESAGKMEDGLIYYALRPTGRTKGQAWMQSLREMDRELGKYVPEGPIFLPLPFPGPKIPGLN